MKESWRWFGPLDVIPLHEVAQTGARVVVTALHEVPYGEVWSVDAIRARQRLVADAGVGLSWEVVESLPVHDDIKRGTGDLDRLFGTYRQSLANLAACGVRTVCYNFMPVLDWTRTDPAVPRRGGGTALRFDEAKMAAFEMHMLERPGAEGDFAPGAAAAGTRWFERSSQAERDLLLGTIMAGLPGAYDRYSIPELRAALARWEGVTADDLRAAYARFLSEIVPAAEDLGIRLCVHPDDPPRPVFGLPRVVSTEGDAAWILGREESRANGLTLCTGAFGAHPGNDLPAMFKRFADRVHFLHLRNVTIEEDGSFFEDDHLAGRVDMVEMVRLVLAEEARRAAEDRADPEIPFRPDHGHELGPDIGRGTHPGYPLVGRLKGLAELRGVISAVSRLAA